jgi:hypothetical protein
MKAERALANFDSAAAMLRALGRYLDGKDFPRVGNIPAVLAPLGAVLNRLPRRVKETVYRLGGWIEAVPTDRLGEIHAETISEWAVGEYPRRRYPAAMVGSSNGALVHLCAALGIPWLPQTFLIPVHHHRSIHPDEPRQSMEWGREPGRHLLEANPDLVLHHMHDANQDRLMIQHMAYFRVKRLRLGAAYTRFLEESLAPGAVLFVVDCRTSWPVTRVGERHVFQSGALGGATPEDYLRGTPRVAEYLKRYNSHRRSWDSPAPDSEAPEAEWGFEPALLDDIERLATRRGWQVRRLIFADPEDMSPPVADFHRWWYDARGVPARRLLVDSFILMEPWWTLRTGSVPFWMVFNTEPSALALERYLDASGPWDEIALMLFSHGVDSVGLVPLERWRALLARARRQGRFVGVDERAYPRDFNVFIRYHRDARRLSGRYPMPEPLDVASFDRFLAGAAGAYRVESRGADDRTGADRKTA